MYISMPGKSTPISSLMSFLSFDIPVHGRMYTPSLQIRAKSFISDTLTVSDECPVSVAQSAKYNVPLIALVRLQPGIPTHH